MAKTSESGRLEGIREVFVAHKMLSSVSSNSDPGVVFRHLAKVFDGDDEPKESAKFVGKKTKKTLKIEFLPVFNEQIKTVYEAYKKLEKWESEEASTVVIAHLEEIFGFTDMSPPFNKKLKTEAAQVKKEATKKCEDEVIFLLEHKPIVATPTSTVDLEPEPKAESPSSPSSPAPFKIINVAHVEPAREQQDKPENNASSSTEDSAQKQKSSVIEDSRDEKEKVLKTLLQGIQEPEQQGKAGHLGGDNKDFAQTNSPGNRALARIKAGLMKCHVCKVQVSAHEHWNHMQQNHTEAEILPFACSICGERFKLINHCNNHEKWKHRRDGSLKKEESIPTTPSQ